MACLGPTVLAHAADSLSAYSAQVGYAREMQYRFQQAESIEGHLALNPFQGLRAEVFADGFSLMPLDVADAVPTRFRFQGMGRDEEGTAPWEPLHAANCGMELLWTGEGLSLQYLHDEAGLRQNFLVPERPDGAGELVLSMSIQGDAMPVLAGTSGVRFHEADGSLRYSYEDLRVWDACGTRLHAYMVLATHGDGHTLQIRVDDEAAVYPITVDPVSTTANRFLVGNQFDAEYGISVATAGDLNGDGFSDVVIGQWLFTSSTHTNCGAAYVFYGSPSGIPASPNVTMIGTQNQGQLGCSVSSAGDVNGDGFSDLIIGARNFTTAGGAFIYHGSPTGVSNVADQVLVSTNPTDKFGSNVACAGDLNGDGYSDVLIGAYLANYGQLEEGAVFVYMGSATGLETTPRHRLERNQASAHFSRSLASAGDINGDGYSDVIIGAPRWNTGNPGAVFIYMGGPNVFGGGVNPAPALTLLGSGNSSAQYGWSVACAGDVNGDGYSDVLVGAYQDQIGPETGEGLCYVYHGSATGLVTTPAIILEGGQDGAWMGRSVSGAGDVNGDGYADILVGVARWTGSLATPNEGAVNLHLGGPAGIQSSIFLRFRFLQAGAILGEAVCTAGDVTGDGYSDIIVGAKLYDGRGAVGIYHGGSYTVSGTPALIRSSGLAEAHAGSSVANAGDINGDGFTDVIVGAPDASNGQVNEGLVYVHYGSATGLNAAPDLVLEMNIAGARFGSAVATAGDVDGDGYADIVVGAPGVGPGGRAYIFRGGPGGLNALPFRTYNGPAGADLGRSVGTAGDINCDGFAEVLVGAPGAGSVYLYEGTDTGPGLTPTLTLSEGGGTGGFGHAVATAGDVNGDGYSDIIVGAPFMANGQANEGLAFVYHGSDSGLTVPWARRLEMDQANARFGWSVSTAGDVNGNGYSDVIVGAEQWSSGEALEGGAFVFRGSPTGIGAIFTTLQVNQVGGRFGTSVAEAGDINGDGYADVVVGCPRCGFSGQTEEGVAFVFIGRPVGINPVQSDQLRPNMAGLHLGTSVSGGGDVDGDGYSEIIAGAPMASPVFTEEGSMYWLRGNQARGRSRVSRQYKADLISPLSTNSKDFVNPDFFGIGHLAFSPTMRTLGRLRWEIAHEGVPFSIGNSITNSVNSTGTAAGWTDLGVTGTELKQLILKTPNYLRFRWRLRVEYHPSRMIDGQRYSRWFYGYASGAGDIGILPVELLSFSGKADGDVNRLEWRTATESGSSHFNVERSLDGIGYQPLGRVQAAGYSVSDMEYAFIDHAPPAGLAYYRLAIVDLDGSSERSGVVTVMRDPSRPVLYPNPAHDVLHIAGLEGRAVLELRLLDGLGRPLRQVRSGSDDPHGVSMLLTGLAAGHYTVVVIDQDGEVAHRLPFVKQ